MSEAESITVGRPVVMVTHCCAYTVLLAELRLRWREPPFSPVTQHSGGENLSDPKERHCKGLRVQYVLK